MLITTQVSNCEEYITGATSRVPLMLKYEYHSMITMTSWRTSESVNISQVSPWQITSFSIRFITNHSNVTEICLTSPADSLVMFGHLQASSLSYCQICFLRVNINFVVLYIVSLLPSWWRHQMETFSALLFLCTGNSPVNSPHKGQWRGALLFSLVWAWTNN